MVDEIKAIARRHLAEDGAAGLSLRAVARDLGMSSSAVYRYVQSRDELLTLLIVDAYDALGEAAERADATVTRRQDVVGRWVAVAGAVRAWALGRPEEWALVYGSPVPGYRAPDATVGPAARVQVVLVHLLEDAVAHGLMALPTGDVPVPAALGRELRELAAGAGTPAVPEPVLARGLLVWASLVGAVSYELFGHLHKVVDERDQLFDHHVAELGRVVGFPVTRRRGRRASAAR